MKRDSSTLIMKTAVNYNEDAARCGAYAVSTDNCKDSNKGCDCCASFDITMLLDE